VKPESNSLASDDRLAARGLSNMPAWMSNGTGITDSNVAKNAYTAPSTNAGKATVKSKKRNRNLIEDDSTDSDDSDIGLCIIGRPNPVSETRNSTSNNATTFSPTREAMKSLEELKAQALEAMNSKSNSSVRKKPKYDKSRSKSKGSSADDCVFYARGYCRSGLTCKFVHGNGNRYYGINGEAGSENETTNGDNSNDSFSAQLDNLIDFRGR
jgi:hypothetical protein